MSLNNCSGVLENLSECFADEKWRRQLLWCGLDCDPETSPGSRRLQLRDLYHPVHASPACLQA
jgi:hypothetical protein